MYIVHNLYSYTPKRICNSPETGKMSIAVACRRSLVFRQSADLYVLWYDNQPIVATSST